MERLVERLQDLMRDTFGDPDLLLQDSLSAEDVPGWDSLAHINLIIAIEQDLGVRFSTAEISRLKDSGQTVGDLVRLVRAKLAA